MAQQKFVGKVEYSKGLEGVIANETKIGYVDGEKGWLVYRGINIFDLAEHSTYEETAYLLLFGKLPNRKELDDFSAKLVSLRPIPKEVETIIETVGKKTHPMSALRTAVSALGCIDPKADEVNVQNCTEVGIKLVAQMATVAGAISRVRQGKPPVSPDPKLSHAANFLYMMTGRKPDDFLARVMDVSLILHADHGMNASTFTSMVVGSTFSDIYSCVTSGISALKGPLHGGANEKALATILSIGSPDKVKDFVKGATERKEKIMGIGHRVYKVYDPRARVLGEYSKEVTEKSGMINIYNTALELEKQVIEAYGGKGIFPNVDFYSGTIYYAMGIEAPMFTPIFAVSRVVGWAARVIEYLADNRLFRPRAAYVGPLEAPYIAMDQRV